VQEETRLLKEIDFPLKIVSAVGLIETYDVGTEEFPNASYGFVDVRDVARAHIQALENSSASGRYCIVGGVMHRPDMSKILHHLYPTLRLPEK